MKAAAGSVRARIGRKSPGGASGLDSVQLDFGGGGATITVVPSPVLPVAPVSPVFPVLPVSPVAPVLPVLPCAPVAPWGPAGPGAGSAAGTVTTAGCRSQALRPSAANSAMIKIERFIGNPLEAGNRRLGSRRRPARHDAPTRIRQPTGW